MKIAPTLILLAGFLGLIACDGVSGKVTSSDEKKTTTPTTPTTPVVEKERVVLDTTVLSGDTTQRIVTTRWKGTTLVSRDTLVVPVEFLWLVNRYGEPVLMEAWAGDSLEWREGRILGWNLKPIPDASASSVPMADGARRRLGRDRHSELVVVAGVPSEAGAVFLATMRYRNVTAGDTLVLNEQGLLVLR
ncbi:MAG: hypothetical protein RL318_2054 [Fibrobacterota bacterium]|jgi:hypothetical protein